MEMQLRVLLPTAILVDEPVSRVVAEAENGEFCLLPRHIDFATLLVPGVLVYRREDGGARYVAVDRGILVKCGQTVAVSTPQGVCGDDLAALEALVEERFLELDEHERRTRTALARLEAATLRRFHDLQERYRA